VAHLSDTEAAVRIFKRRVLIKMFLSFFLSFLLVGTYS